MARKNPTTLAQIKADPRVKSVWKEENGYGGERSKWSWWVLLVDEFMTDDGITCIHEVTVRELCAELRNVLPRDANNPII